MDLESLQAPRIEPQTQPEPTRTVMRVSEPCPRCGLGRLDYNGLLELECPVCGYHEGGGCT